MLVLLANPCAAAWAGHLPFGRPDDALLVIDVQRCFLPGGSLPVPEGDAVVPVINRLAPHFKHVVLTQDWHPQGHVSFASSHSGRPVFSEVRVPYGTQKLWPNHCIQGSQDAELAPGLNVPHAALILRKGTSPQLDSYSALFEADGQTPTGLHAWLAAKNIRRLVLVGLATDYCVLATALDARRLGYPVVVIEEATRGIDQGGSLQRAWSTMRLQGVQRLTVQQMRFQSDSAGP
ncbi:MAG: bifunctional nicotinamidase/pyrazinamidase [Prochlorococcaceae cyanobacterium]